MRGFFGRPPPHIKPELSTYGQLSTALLRWITPATVRYVAGPAATVSQVTEAEADASQAAEVTDHTASLATVQFQNSLLQMLSQELPVLVREMNIRVPESEVSKRVSQLVRSFAFRAPVPGWSAQLWQTVALVMLDALSRRQLLGLRDMFDAGAGRPLVLRQLVALKAVLEEHDALTSLFFSVE